jgi:5-methylcytosine-specific restriction endonuclease McrA
MRVATAKMNNTDDLSGRQFGRLTVIRKSDRERHWICICQCGSETCVRKDHLINGDTLSCGCFNQENRFSIKKSIVGKRFGRLVVVEQRPYQVVIAMCDCGNEKITTRTLLTTGDTKSCGCYNREASSQRNFIDIKGKSFGRLTAIKVHGRNKSNKILWECLCICGNTTNVLSGSLVGGYTRSCGCLARETAIITNTTHGMSKTREYRKAIKVIRRERQKKLDSLWTTEMEMLLSSTFPKCVICGSPDNLETDHVNPLSSGYGLKPGNAVKLCHTCNVHKSYLPLSSLPEDKRDKIIVAANLFNNVWKFRK